MLWSLFKKVEGLQSCNFITKRLQYDVVLFIIVNFEHISHFFLEFIADFEQLNAC